MESQASSGAASIRSPVPGGWGAADRDSPPGEPPGPCGRRSAVRTKAGAVRSVQARSASWSSRACGGAAGPGIRMGTASMAGRPRARYQSPTTASAPSSGMPGSPTASAELARPVNPPPARSSQPPLAPPQAPASAAPPPAQAHRSPLPPSQHIRSCCYPLHQPNSALSLFMTREGATLFGYLRPNCRRRSSAASAPTAPAGSSSKNFTRPGRLRSRSHQPQDFAWHVGQGLEALIWAEKAASHMPSQQQ